MIKINSFGIIGGDKRQLMMAKSIVADGYKVYMTGFETIDTTVGTWIDTTLENTVNNSDVLILPLPITKDNKTLNSTYADRPIYLNSDFAGLISGKRVYCGMKSQLLKLCSELDPKLIYDYMLREEFAVQNAVPTSEGAIEIAMREYSGTINGSRCLVIGYGRIGRVLAAMLKGIGAYVTVASRKKQDMAWSHLAGYNAVRSDKLHETGGFDIVFNTVPYVLLDAHTLAKTCDGAIVIDLASQPGGVDKEAAKRLGIRCTHALSLPGRVAPKAAGEIIKNTVYNMLEEEYE